MTQDTELLTQIAVAGIDYLTLDQTQLAEYRFSDESAFLAEAREHFKGVVLLQTCNRVEILVHGTGTALTDYLHSIGRSGFVLYEGQSALLHLLALASGVKSMIIGEDQILGQLKRALLLSAECGTADPITDICINTAIHAGVDIRSTTRINRGAVSIGSVAVQLAEELLGSLDDRNILVVGGGEMGKLVTQALAEKNLRAIYVTNRTYNHAVELAQEVGGRAMRMDQLYPCIALSDVVISCTAAPHAIINAEPLAIAMNERFWPLDPEPRKLILIDIAQPRDTDDSCRRIPGVHLFTIDDLRSVSEKNMEHRKDEATHANEMIDAYLPEFVRLYNRTAAGDLIAGLYTWAESIRVRERDKAIGKLGPADPRTIAIMDDLTRVLTKKLLADATMSIRASAECTDITTARKLVDAITRGEQVCFLKHD
ncbi:glutamyl-tRNA reductase [Methanorbis rubei]|uniref:Glutamyl-tRNA reductase n=1 Tax=Methanorbis rubei TaxID=3028300 RepID=A0AAE4MI36_9EURY|nr:Glutamyl-tRNA reductase [Methanocorpusculaceae archaeon Cs1]